MRLTHVFLVSLLASLVLQGIYWKHFEVLDGHVWIKTTEALMVLAPDMFNPFTYGYPGTPPMMLAIMVHWLFGVPIKEAFYGSLALIISGATSGAAFVCKLIRPHFPWWIGTTVALSTTALYSRATPPSTVVLPFIVLIILLSLYIYEQKPRHKKWPFVWLGIVVGISAAARLDITLFVAGIQAVFLLVIVGWSPVIFTILVALLFFCLLNPFMWLFPIHHLSAFVHKIFYHYRNAPSTIPPFSAFFKTSPFSWLGIFYGIIFAVWRTKEEIVPRIFILNVLFITVTLSILLYFSTYRPLWYFSPILLVWEVIFLLLLLELSSRATYMLGFSRQSIFNLYLAARLGIFIALVFKFSPALSFFT